MSESPLESDVDDMDMVMKKSIKEFRESGLLWFINNTLHMFGWAIVYDLDNETIYPARVKYRGFQQDINTNGYIKVSKYLKKNINQLLKEAQE